MYGPGKRTQFDLFKCFNSKFKLQKVLGNGSCSPNIIAVVGFTKLLADFIFHFKDIFNPFKPKRISYSVLQNVELTSC